MGCVQSYIVRRDMLKAMARSEEIDHQIQQDHMLSSNEINILFFGCPGSGTSTLLKQMKLIHHDGCSRQERDSHKEVIYTNTVQSMRAVLEAMPYLNLSLAPINSARRAVIMSLPRQIETGTLPPSVIDAILGLWEDPSVRKAVRRSNEFQLNSSAEYYFSSMDRMAMPNYVPTDKDILESSVKTTGITEATFKVGELSYKLLNMSGQRSEMRKWIHHFGDVTALIFVVGLSNYDEFSFEDEGMNRMQESLALFDSICNSQWLMRTPTILLLNKIDIFAGKLLNSPLRTYFPDYKGGSDYDAACQYILRRFTSLNKSAGSRQIYAHYTCSTDTQLMKFILGSFQDILLQAYLQSIGLL